MFVKEVNFDGTHVTVFQDKRQHEPEKDSVHVTEPDVFTVRPENQGTRHRGE